MVTNDPMRILWHVLNNPSCAKFEMNIYVEDGTTYLETGNYPPIIVKEGSPVSLRVQGNQWNSVGIELWRQKLKSAETSSTKGDFKRVIRNHRFCDAISDGKNYYTEQEYADSGKKDPEMIRYFAMLKDTA